MRKDRWGPDGVTWKEKAQLLLTENVRGQHTGGVLASGGAEAAGEAEVRGQASQAPRSGLLARGARSGVGLGVGCVTQAQQHSQTWREQGHPETPGAPRASGMSPRYGGAASARPLPPDSLPRAGPDGHRAGSGNPRLSGGARPSAKLPSAGRPLHEAPRTLYSPRRHPSAVHVLGTVGPASSPPGK